MRYTNRYRQSEMCWDRKYQTMTHLDLGRASMPKLRDNNLEPIRIVLTHKENTPNLINKQIDSKPSFGCDQTKLSGPSELQLLPEGGGMVERPRRLNNRA